MAYQVRTNWARVFYGTYTEEKFERGRELKLLAVEVHVRRVRMRGSFWKSYCFNFRYYGGRCNISKSRRINYIEVMYSKLLQQTKSYDVILYR